MFTQENSLKSKEFHCTPAQENGKSRDGVRISLKSVQRYSGKTVVRYKYGTKHSRYCNCAKNQSNDRHVEHASFSRRVHNEGNQRLTRTENKDNEKNPWCDVLGFYLVHVGMFCIVLMDV